jgi:mono/diheme cytochrome c family protein
VKDFILGMLCGFAILAAGGYFLVERGYADFGADRTPSPTEASIAMRAVDEWSARNARGATNPVPTTDDNITQGATLYLDHCAGCHGVPSNPISNFQRSFYPPAPGFFREMPDMNDASTFYIIKRGIRWTGMPAWNRTLSDEEIWQVVVFFDNMHKLPPAAEKVFEPYAAKSAPAR